MKLQLILLFTSVQVFANTTDFEPFESPYSSDESVQVAKADSNENAATELDSTENNLKEMPEFDNQPGFEALTSEEIAQLEGIYSQKGVSTKQAGIQKNKSQKKSKKAVKPKKGNRKNKRRA